MRPETVEALAVPAGATTAARVSLRTFGVLHVSFAAGAFTTRREAQRFWDWLTARAWFEHVHYGRKGYMALIVPVAAAGARGAPALVRLAYQQARKEGCALLLFCQRD